MKAAVNSFGNIRCTRAALFTKFAAHLPHIKQFKGGGGGGGGGGLTLIIL